ncbi:acyl-CoA N-acyltransferase [Xylariaceae sp. FL1019]|nr:acyl-CoA N-acyltransferase [Xylariaceae sp. FL1019]
MAASMTPLKRKRAAMDPIEEANGKSDEVFLKESLRPSASWTTWTHPKTKSNYSLSLHRSDVMNEKDMDMCYNLIEETSRADYEASTTGWNGHQKRTEMKSAGLRYLLVKETRANEDEGNGGGDPAGGRNEDGAEDEGAVKGFCSFMPTYEEGEAVVYCYEIHLGTELRGTGLGRLLLSYLENVAFHTPPIEKVMLTCFLSNQIAYKFYQGNGFVIDPISPEPRKLRFGKEFRPDYAILSKVVERGHAGAVG